MSTTVALALFGPLPADLSSLGLPACALLLLDKLRFFYCRAQPFCWPSDKELARRTGLSIHQVRRGLRHLERAGLIRRRTTTIRLDNGRLRRRRFIDLLFTGPGAGAQHEPAPAPTRQQAPARKQEVVVVEGQLNSNEAGADRRQRERPEPPAAPPGPEVGTPARVAHELQDALQDTQGAAPDPGRAEPPSAPTPAAPASEALGEAMTRVFSRMGAEMPALTPSAPSPSSGGPTSHTPPPSPPPVRSRPGLTAADLEALAASGDPILAGELARRKAAEARRAAAAAIPPPATTAELLSRIRESPSYVSQAAQALAVELGDERSWRGLHAICCRAYEGELDPAALVHALGKAKGPKVRKPGAIFTVEVCRWRGP